MSKKANPTSIGLFIVIGVALGVVGLMLFGSSRLFTQTRECIVYFNDSLNGLNEGAPVKYRGVTIGAVKRVMIRFKQATNDYAMPVIIEFQRSLLQDRLGEEQDGFTAEALERRIRLGLRASLESESLVTGVLFVEIRPVPNASPPVYHELVPVYPEIPTEPTRIQQLLSNLASMDIKGIGDKLNSLLSKLDSTMASLNVTEINSGLTNLLVSLDRLAESPQITNALSSIGSTLDQYRRLGEKLDGQVDPLVNGITNTLAEADLALIQIRGSAANLRSLIAPDSPLGSDLDQALQQLAGAARAISGFVDFLNQHPNALITGREILEKKP